MCEPTPGAAQAAPQFNLPTFNQESVRHILLGDYSALVDAINRIATQFSASVFYLLAEILELPTF